MKRALAFLVATSIPFGGCEMHQELGGTSTTGSGGAGGSGTSAVPDGHWTGYVEDTVLDDASNALALDLESTGTVLSGHVRFGSRDLYAPPTDPNIGYPPPLDAHPHDSAQWLTGFEFTMVGVTYDGGHLRFSIDPGEMWSAWCALETPIGNSCLPPLGYSSNFHGCYLVDDQGTQTPVDCGKLNLCSERYVCSCNANGCSQTSEAPVGFDLDLTGDTASGHVDGVYLGGDGLSTRNVVLDRE